MQKLISLLGTTVLAGAVFVACDQLPEQPTTLDQEAQASHHPGGEGNADADAVMRALDTEAARRHGFDEGEVIGDIFFTDDGTTLTTTGHASGLDPGNDGGYLSLVYDNESEAEGKTACEPGISNPNDPEFLSNAQMFIGAWSVDAAGDGTLGPETNSGDAYAPLSLIRTVSIRDTRIGGGFGPQAVVACGLVN